MPPMKPLRRRLLAKLFRMAKELEIDKDRLTEYCAEWTGLTPTAGSDGQLHLISRFDLNHLQVCVHNLEEAKRFGTVRRVEYDDLGRPIIEVQQKQVRKIAKLGFMLHWPTRAIREFLAKETRGRVRDWNDLTLAEATSVIVGMERILEHQTKRRKNAILHKRWNIYE